MATRTTIIIWVVIGCVLLGLDVTASVLWFLSGYMVGRDSIKDNLVKK